MEAEFRFARKNDTVDLLEFFDKNLDKDIWGGAVSREFLCPFGLKSAVNRGQVVIVVRSEELVAALRFYPRKTSDTVSIYQFAFAKDAKMDSLFTKNLKKIGYKKSMYYVEKRFDFKVLDINTTNASLIESDAEKILGWCYLVREKT